MTTVENAPQLCCLLRLPWHTSGRRQTFLDDFFGFCSTTSQPLFVFIVTRRTNENRDRIGIFPHDVQGSLDINLENNMGQENTDVHGLNPGHVQPGEVVDVDIPIFNHAGGEARFAFAADSYVISTDRDFELRLQTNAGTESWPLSRRLGAFGVSLTQPRKSGPSKDKERPRTTTRLSDRWKLTGGRTQPRHTSRGRYVGHQALRDELLNGDFRLPEGMRFRVVDGGGGVVVGRGATVDVPVQLEVPANAQPGQKYSVNVTARRADGAVVGGVTIFLEVES